MSEFWSAANSPILMPVNSIVLTIYPSDSKRLELRSQSRRDVCSFSVNALILSLELHRFLLPAAITALREPLVGEWRTHPSSSAIRKVWLIGLAMFVKTDRPTPSAIFLL